MLRGDSRETRTASSGGSIVEPMRACPSVVSLLVLVAACSSEHKPPPAPAPPVTPPATGSAAPAAATAPPPDALPPEDPKVRAAYRAGMREGRKATDAKRYKVAIAGFDAAIVAKPNDARALGERGYARLLEGSDLDAAMRDLDAAASGTKDRKHLSTIWFNRGLLHEKRGDATNATASFAIANLMRPTKAAAAKLVGKAACTVEVLRAFAIEDHLPVQAADWLALAKALPHNDDEVPADTEDALDRLTDAKTEPELPTIVATRTFDQEVAYVVWRARGKLMATPIGLAWRGRCSGSMEFAIEDSTNSLVHVTGAEEAMGGHTYMCEGKGDDLVECQGADDEVPAGTACLGGSTVIRDLVIDLATGRTVIAVEQFDTGTPRPKIVLTDNALTIRGQNCARTEPL